MMGVDTEELTEAGRRLNSFAIHLLRAMRRVDAESGLTPARLSALSILHFGGPRTLGRLARDEDVTSATMCRLVDALCELGLAERGPQRGPERGVVGHAERLVARDWTRRVLPAWALARLPWAWLARACAARARA